MNNYANQLIKIVNDVVNRENQTLIKFNISKSSTSRIRTGNRNPKNLRYNTLEKFIKLYNYNKQDEYKEFTDALDKLDFVLKSSFRPKELASLLDLEPEEIAKLSYIITSLRNGHLKKEYVSLERLSQILEIFDELNKTNK